MNQTSINVDKLPELGLYFFVQEDEINDMRKKGVSYSDIKKEMMERFDLLLTAYIETHEKSNCV